MCPNIFTLCKNPISWELRRFEGYKLSKPLSTKITHLLFIDDLRNYTKSFSTLRLVMSYAKKIMLDAGMEWNMKKTLFLNIVRGKVDSSGTEMTLEDGSIINHLRTKSFISFWEFLRTTRMTHKN